MVNLPLTLVPVVSASVSTTVLTISTLRPGIPIFKWRLISAWVSRAWCPVFISVLWLPSSAGSASVFVLSVVFVCLSVSVISAVTAVSALSSVTAAAGPFWGSSSLICFSFLSYSLRWCLALGCPVPTKTATEAVVVALWPLTIRSSLTFRSLWSSTFSSLRCA